MPTAKPYAYAYPQNYLIHYAGNAGRQFKFSLGRFMDQQYRQSGVAYGLLHALSTRMASEGQRPTDLRPYFWNDLTNT